MTIRRDSNLHEQTNDSSPDEPIHRRRVSKEGVGAAEPFSLECNSLLSVSTDSIPLAGMKRNTTARCKFRARAWYLKESPSRMVVRKQSMSAWESREVRRDCHKHMRLWRECRQCDAFAASHSGLQVSVASIAFPSLRLRRIPGGSGTATGIRGNASDAFYQRSATCFMLALRY